MQIVESAVQDRVKYFRFSCFNVDVGNLGISEHVRSLIYSDVIGP